MLIKQNPISLIKAIFFSINILWIASCTGPTIKNGEELIKEMRNHWKNKWYKNYTVDIEVMNFNNDTISKKTNYYAAINAPGNVILKLDTKNSDDGMIYKNDSVYYIKNGHVTYKRKEIHILSFFGNDIYLCPPDISILKAKNDLNIDLKKFHQRTWKGKEIYVAGTSDTNDLKSNQFWVDKETLCSVRIIVNIYNIAYDYIIENYQKINGNTIATEYTSFVNNKKRLKQKFTNVRFPEKLDNSLFSLSNFEDARW